MPISTNAPFNEFGQSQILRDIEQLYLALNGAGSGGPGDGQTQDQTAVTSQDSGGLPDLSNLATIPYVDSAIAAIPSVTYPISIANGGTAATTAALARLSLGCIRGSNVSHSTTTTTTIPAGVYRIQACLVAGGGGGGDTGTTRYYTSGPDYVDIGYMGAGGGAGQLVIVSIDVTPGETYTATIGAAGARLSNGGNTSLSFASDSYIVTATGGGGAVAGPTAGVGGGRRKTVAVLSSYNRNATCVALAGADGQGIGLGTASGTSSYGGHGYILDLLATGASTVHGKGGDGGSTGSSGEAGGMIIFY